MSRYSIYTIIGLLCVVGLVVLFPHVSIAATFLRNLSEGDTGTDVQLLQKILNQNEQTVVALSGPGSTGNETMYFGAATRGAVVRFQNLYASQILKPAGLTVGTGFVGPSTRAMLDVFAHTLTSPSVSTPEPTQAPSVPGVAYSATLPGAVDIPNTTGLGNLTQFDIFSDEDNDTVQVAFLSSNAGMHGSSLTITGTGFDLTNNTVHVGPHTISNVAATSAHSLTVAIPYTIPVGVYDLEVSNSKGISKSAAFFVVTQTTASAPTITSVSPSVASFGDEVTIMGTNFTATGNMVYGTLGVFSNLSSVDGTTITVELKAPSHLAELESLFEIDEEHQFTTYVMVANTNGVSNPQAPGVITIE